MCEHKHSTWMANRRHSMSDKRYVCVYAAYQRNSISSTCSRDSWWLHIANSKPVASQFVKVMQPDFIAR
jgi:hypothetical protein